MTEKKSDGNNFPNTENRKAQTSAQHKANAERMATQKNRRANGAGTNYGKSIKENKWDRILKKGLSKAIISDGTVTKKSQTPKTPTKTF